MVWWVGCSMFHIFGVYFFHCCESEIFKPNNKMCFSLTLDYCNVWRPDFLVIKVITIYRFISACLLFFSYYKSNVQKLERKSRPLDQRYFLLRISNSMLNRPSPNSEHTERKKEWKKETEPFQLSDCVECRTRKIIILFTLKTTSEKWCRSLIAKFRHHFIFRQKENQNKNVKWWTFNNRLPNSRGLKHTEHRTSSINIENVIMHFFW